MLDPRLDVLARGELAVEHLAYQLGQLRIAGKAERDQLPMRQLVDAGLQIVYPATQAQPRRVRLLIEKIAEAFSSSGS